MSPLIESIPLILLLGVSFLTEAVAFSSYDSLRRPLTLISRTQLCSTKSANNNDPIKGKNGKIKFGQRTVTEESRFLADFRTATGEIIDPYSALRVPRTATLDEIKTSYRKLSRKLHPDAVSKSNILPGKCSNLDEVREQWEKVTFSYEILSNPKSRKSYDRNSSVAEALEDPGGAVGRAVVGGAFTAVGMGFGAMWKVGELAVKGVSAVAQPTPITKQTTNNVQNQNAQPQVESQVSAKEENNDVDKSNQARIWTLEEMRAAANSAAASVPNTTTETIPIALDSNKAGTPIFRDEEPQKPESSAKIESNSSSRISQEVNSDGFTMITPVPIATSSTKTKRKRRMPRSGTGFSKK